MHNFIHAFPPDFLLDLHTRFEAGDVDGRLGFINDFVEKNRHNMSPDFLNKEVVGNRALIFYQGKRYNEAAGQYILAVENSSPDDLLFLHEHCMVARCYRLAGEFEKSEEWIKKTYALKHLVAHALELLDVFADYVALLMDTGRQLDEKYLPDIRWIIMEAGMEVRLNETDLNQVVLEMKKLNHEENIHYSQIHLLFDRDQDMAVEQLRKFIAGSRVRFYKQMAQEYLQKLGLNT